MISEMVLQIWYSMISSTTFPTKLARLSLAMSMAESSIFSKPKTMLFDHLVWFSEGIQSFERLLSLILTLLDGQTNRLTSGLIGLLPQQPTITSSFLIQISVNICIWNKNGLTPLKYSFETLLWYLFSSITFRYIVTNVIWDFTLLKSWAPTAVKIGQTLKIPKSCHI